MESKEFLKCYTQVFWDQDSSLARTEGRWESLLLSDSYYYRKDSYPERYIDTLNRLDLLGLIQTLGITENAQRITPEQLVVNVNRLREEAARLQAEVKHLTGEVADITSQRQREVESLNGAIQVRDAEIDRLSGELSGLRDTVAAVYASTSWKITAPVRSLSRAMAKLKHMPDRSAGRLMEIARAMFRRLPFPAYRKYQLKNFISVMLGNRVPSHANRTQSNYRLNHEKYKNVDAVLPDTGNDKSAFDRLAAVELAAFLADKQKLELPQSCSPKVSIILVLFNRASLTLACLRSIKACAEQPLEVVIVDNASTDDTGYLLGRLEGARVLRNASNVGFLHACNQAAQVALGDMLLFLNNDAQLLPGSLSSALRTLESSLSVGAVGGKIILLDGALQEAGSIVWKDGTCYGYGRGAFPFAPMYMFQRDVDYCSGAFLLTKRQVFNELGGFDATFAPAYYEETDYCFRLRQRGLITVYDPNAVILHYEFGSALSPHDGIAQQAVNRNVFVARHVDALSQQYDACQENILRARQAKHDVLRVLYLEDRVPHRGLGRGYPRSNHIISLLIELGLFVTLYPMLFPIEDWPQVYSDIPHEVEVMVGYGAQELESFLQERQGYYDILFVSRPHNMEVIQEIRKRRPDLLEGSKIIYDAEALFAAREALRREVEGHPLAEKEKQKLIHIELELASYADTVIAVSEAERRYFVNQSAERTCVLGHSLAPSPTPNNFSARRNILFVGAISDDLSPNADSLLWFVRETLPRIRERLNEDIILLIAGLNASKKVAALQDYGVKMLGYVEDLFPLYNASRIFIAPTRFAGGVPYKAHEAAARGLPMVVSSLIASQLGWNDGIDLLAAQTDDPAVFAEKCERLYTDSALWAGLRENALRRMETECSPEAFKKALQEIFLI